MSQENIEVVRAAYDAVNRGDLDAAISNIGSEMEYVASGASPARPGSTSVLRVSSGSSRHSGRSSTTRART
jgi:ketosteroid isomerase-like protein